MNRRSVFNLKCTVTLTANAGIILELPGAVLLVDALHNKKAMEFSTLDSSSIETLFSRFDVCPPDGILVTHSHIDHYSTALVDEASQRYSCPVFAPWKDGMCEYAVNGVSIQPIALSHRKADTGDFGKHFGFIINKDDKTVLIAGDAEPLSDEMTALCASLSPNLAVLPFVWVTLKRHREALDVLNPSALVLNHLPFIYEDTFGYNKAAETQVNARYPGCVILNSFLQTAEFEI